MFQFEKINSSEHKNLIIAFRRDSFRVSFGNDDNFGEDKEYVEWVQKCSECYPEGFVLVKHLNQYVGQLELQIMKYKDEDIGYVNLYYLIPSYRGKGYGKYLDEYAMKFFNSKGVKEYHLRVSPMNQQAIAFYKKNGMKEVGLEVDGKVVRMKGTVINKFELSS
ncbi:GNAT family N-acetyltransferase [Shimazuella kribbensis]|uniref:GNAT family N-acetyltransferase n=1 Tax=Shimazuella kribbensis TaxID=139808 RepID=UPI0004161D48|nr:GNAT family N-acetyltransferase [Shimazuella kribbensis]